MHQPNTEQGQFPWSFEGTLHHQCATWCVGTMSRSKHSTNAFVLACSILIILSNLAVLGPPVRTGGGEWTRGNGDTLYVDDDSPDGGDGSLERPYNRIRDAIDGASVGDTIRVFEGTYNEDIEVNRESLSLIGNGSDESTIQGSGNGDVVHVTADRCTVKGFSI